MALTETRKKRLETETGWIKIEDWFYKIPEGKRARSISWWGYNISHRCSENTVRACTGLRIYRGARKTNIYGYCSNCKARLPSKIKTIITLCGATGEI